MYFHPLLSNFHIIVSSSRVCTCWSASDGPWFFSMRARGDWQATIRRNLEDYQAWVWHFLSYVFWHFPLLWCLDAKIVSSFISAFLCLQSCIQTKTIVDVYLLYENETSGCLLYMCTRIWLIYYSIRYSRERFPSSWVFAGHRYVPLFHILGAGRDSLSSLIWLDLLGPLSLLWNKAISQPSSP